MITLSSLLQRHDHGGWARRQRVRLGGAAAGSVAHDVGWGAIVKANVRPPCNWPLVSQVFSNGLPPNVAAATYSIVGPAPAAMIVNRGLPCPTPLMTTDGNIGDDNSHASTPGCAWYRPIADSTYAADIVPASSLPGSPYGVALNTCASACTTCIVRDGSPTQS